MTEHTIVSKQGLSVYTRLNSCVIM